MPNDAAVEGFNFEAIGGLPVLGVRGVVMVGHGVSGPKAYHNMVLRTAEVVRSGLLARMEAALAPAIDPVK
jgi:phosphate acyltransferase